ncbi:MAG: hypothetical protein FJ096_19165 [Deltaproteobacteria bacterium]|nr:hypothetical protein [Deltaproteobacteria bacterium]
MTPPLSTSTIFRRLALGSLALAAGCQLLVVPDRTRIEDATAATSTTASTSASSGGGTGGSAGAGGAGPE